MGLYISKRVTEKLGGELSLESEPNFGTSVTLKLDLLNAGDHLQDVPSQTAALTS